MTITANARQDGVSVEVAPGGALRSIELTPEALRAGGTRLARTILAVVDEATARANQRAKHEMAVDGLTEADAAVLGLAQDAALTEAAEGTTPERWRV
ncbi:YbaB/EbfC family nucleoid-associated protein [Amycolatopsis sp. GM8]|uniref:YbaB/EbfC family nucleoid-associated protein n=1 Tax=Amycolatopsis sp. GM8 TaxID=2896530 RepID=UPI001F1E0C83|nr:YbaB/EbfC family nucleoid-associated protein [Amycolatopsis sp. GM8]